MTNSNRGLIAGIGVGIAIALSVVALLVAALFPASGSRANAQTQPTTTTETAKTSQITVRGTGTFAAKPDTLKMNVGVSEQDTNVKGAQDKVNKATDAMIAKLKEANVSDKDYRTNQYSVEPVMDYGSEKGPNQLPKLTGFRVVSVLEITLREPARAPELLDALVTAGANTVYNVSYGFADPESLERQAYNGAVQNAEAKATKLAGLTNLKLGKIVNVTEANANVPGPLYGAEMGKGGGAGFVPGQQTVQVDVIVTYEVTQQ